MNKWKQIWYAYSLDATFFKILKGVWDKASKKESPKKSEKKTTKKPKIIA